MTPDSGVLLLLFVLGDCLARNADGSKPSIGNWTILFDFTQWPLTNWKRFKWIIYKKSPDHSISKLYVRWQLNKVMIMCKETAIKLSKFKCKMSKHAHLRPMPRPSLKKTDPHFWKKTKSTHRAHKNKENSLFQFSHMHSGNYINQASDA